MNRRPPADGVEMEFKAVPQGPGEPGSPCIWMSAGVVRKKWCHGRYACTGCRFDRAMRRAARKNREAAREGRRPGTAGARLVSWKDKLMALPPPERPCIHHLKGRIRFRSCAQAYACGRCEFDQYFTDHFSVRAVIRAVDFLETGGIRFPQGYYLHRGHSWVKVESGTQVRVGMDEFALRVTGPLDRIEAPLIGKRTTRNRPGVSVWRGDRRARLLSPVHGVVTAINPDLREKGRIANDDPYSDGWIMTVRPDNLRRDLGGLMMNEESRLFMEAELDRLHEMLDEMTGPLGADGGAPGNDIYGALGEKGWDALISAFLRT